MDVFNNSTYLFLNAGISEISAECTFSYILMTSFRFIYEIWQVSSEWLRQE